MSGVTLAGERSGNRMETFLLGTATNGSVLVERAAAHHGRQRYCPYGHSPAQPAVTSRMGFNGQRREPQGWYHLGNGHRVYNPALRRFHSPDGLSPFGEGGLNPYTYCLGDPINFTDPTGQKVEAGHIASFIIQSTVFVLSMVTLITPMLASAGYLVGMRAAGVSLTSRLGTVEAISTGMGLISSPLGLISSSLQTQEPPAIGSELMWAMVSVSLSATFLNFGASVVPTKGFVEGSRMHRFARLVHGRKKLEAARSADDALEMGSMTGRTLPSPTLADVTETSVATLPLPQSSVAMPVATRGALSVQATSSRINHHARTLRGGQMKPRREKLRLSTLEMDL